MFHFLYGDTRKLCLFHDYHSQVKTEREGESWTENNVLRGLGFKEEFAYKNNIYSEESSENMFMHENSMVSFESRKF